MNTYATGICKLTCDPEIRTVGDTVVAKFRVVINGRVVKKNGAVVMENGYAKRETLFWGCECWGPQGQMIVDKFKKGSRIALVGNFKQDEVDKNGTTQTYTTLKVDNWQFVDAAGDSAPEEAAPAPAKKAAPAPAGKAKGGKPAAAPVDAFASEEDDGNIPF